MPAADVEPGGVVAAAALEEVALARTETLEPNRLYALHDQAALAHLPRGDVQRAALCSRDNADPVSIKLCAEKAPSSLGDLLKTLDLEFTSAIGNGELGNPSFALLSHSTSLAARQVSPINPRVFIFKSPKTEGPLRGAPEKDPGFIALAFSRGEPLVELVARDAKSGELRFFLIRFELGCEYDGGCDASDLFSAEIETGWQLASVYDDSDLENTLFDCNTCHQPGGPDSPKMLRMIEQRPPWTHFFRDNDQGKLLIGDYFRAHDKSETYGGIPGRLISWSEPARLEGLVEHEGFIEQPLELPTRDLARMVMKGEAPANLPAYIALWEKARVGRSLPVPFPDYAFVEPAELAGAAAAYRGMQKETVPAARFSDLHSDSARVRVGLAPEPDAPGETIALQMCARCHNDALDQSVSRARFNAGDLASLGAEQKTRVIERLRLPATSPLKMPPARFGSLSTAEIASVAEALGR